METLEKNAPGFDIGGRQAAGHSPAPGKTSWPADRLLDAIADVEAGSERRYHQLRREIEQIKRRRGIAGDLGLAAAPEDLYQALIVFAIVYAGARILQSIFQGGQ